MNRSGMGSLTTLLLLAAINGCQSAPVGDDGGRLDPYSTRNSEKNSPQANAASLLSFSDATVDHIVTELATLKRDLDPSTSYVLYVGELENKTSATPTGDFEMFQKRVRAKLVNEPRIREVFAIRNDPRGAIRQAERVAAPTQAPRDLLQENGRPQQGLAGMDVAVDPRYQFVLSGEFADTVRNGRSLFFLNFQVINVATGDVVMSSNTDLAQGN